MKQQDSRSALDQQQSPTFNVGMALSHRRPPLWTGHRSA